MEQINKSFETLIKNYILKQIVEHLKTRESTEEVTLEELQQLIFVKEKPKVQRKKPLTVKKTGKKSEESEKDEKDEKDEELEHSENHEETEEIKETKKVETKKPVVKAKKNSSVEKTVASDKTCVFEYSRGPKKGEKCGKKTVKDTDFCSTHSNTKTKKTKELELSIPVNEEIQEEEKKVINVDIYDKDENLFLEKEHNFIIHQISDTENEIIGKLVNDEIVDIYNEKDKEESEKILKILNKF